MCQAQFWVLRMQQRTYRTKTLLSGCLPRSEDRTDPETALPPTLINHLPCEGTKTGSENSQDKHRPSSPSPQGLGSIWHLRPQGSTHTYSLQLALEIGIPISQMGITH